MAMSSRRPPSLLEHTKIGNYAVVQFLGAGGMAEVYEVEHVFTRGRHALKILHTRYTGELGPSIAMQLEAMVEAQLRHENIVRCTDAGEHDGRPWIVMDLLTHMTGDKLIRLGPLPLEVVARIVSQLASALEAAHKRGIVHRDVKPSNFHVLHDGLVKLGDFGFLMAPEDAVSMSRDEIMPGTPAYMAPEQLACEKIDHRADIFALGQVTYEMILGRHGWGSVGRPPAYAEMLRRSRQLPPSLCDLIQGFPSSLWRILARALAPEREKRYSRVADFARDFASAVAHYEEKHGSNALRIREGRPVYVPSFAHVTGPQVVFRRHWVTKALVAFREEMAAQFSENEPSENGHLAHLDAEDLRVQSGSFTAWATLHDLSARDDHDEDQTIRAPCPTPCAWESAPGDATDRSTREPSVVSVIDPTARWSDPTDPTGPSPVSASSSPITPVSISRARPHEQRHEPTLALGSLALQPQQRKAAIPSNAARSLPQVERSASSNAAREISASSATTLDNHDTIVDAVPYALRSRSATKANSSRRWIWTTVGMTGAAITVVLTAAVGKRLQLTHADAVPGSGRRNDVPVQVAVISTERAPSIPKPNTSAEVVDATSSAAASATRPTSDVSKSGPRPSSPKPPPRFAPRTEVDFDLK